MKRVLIILCSLSVITAQAQFSNNFSDNFGSVKLGAGYVQDFPGLGGYAIGGEFSVNMTYRFEGSIGIKRMNMEGYPRTSEVEEYTRATTIDFNVFFLPVHNEAHIIRIGVGYAFSSYSIRRSYPVVTTNGIEKQTSWPVQDKKSRTAGVSVIAEYEYLIANSNISLGVRTALYKAYDRVSYVGPFVGLRF